jgi:hypothetical protein
MVLGIPDGHAKSLAGGRMLLGMAAPMVTIGAADYGAWAAVGEASFSHLIFHA